MAPGKYTLYRGTHRKAIAWFVGFSLITAVAGIVLLRCASLCQCGITEAPPTLGRFIVTPETMRYVELPIAYPSLAESGENPRRG